MWGDFYKGVGTVQANHKGWCRKLGPVTAGWRGYYSPGPRGLGAGAGTITWASRPESCRERSLKRICDPRPRDSQPRQPPWEGARGINAWFHFPPSSGLLKAPQQPSPAGSQRHWPHQCHCPQRSASRTQNRAKKVTSGAEEHRADLEKHSTLPETASSLPLLAWRPWPSYLTSLTLRERLPLNT